MTAMTAALFMLASFDWESKAIPVAIFWGGAYILTFFVKR